MERLSELIEAANDRLGRTVAWLALIMVLLMAAIVVLRYAFQFGSIAMQESVMYLNAALFTLGASYTLKEQGHVRVDVFYSRFSPRLQALVDLLGTALLLVPAAGFIIYVSWDYVSLSWRIREGSAEASGLPLVYLLKTCLLLLPALLLLQGLSEAFKAWRRWRVRD